MSASSPAVLRTDRFEPDLAAQCVGCVGEADDPGAGVDHGGRQIVGVARTADEGDDRPRSQAIDEGAARRGHSVITPAGRPPAMERCSRGSKYAPVATITAAVAISALPAVDWTSTTQPPSSFGDRPTTVSPSRRSTPTTDAPAAGRRLGRRPTREPEADDDDVACSAGHLRRLAPRFGSPGMGGRLPEPGAATVLLDGRDGDAALGGDDPRHVKAAQIALTIAERGSAAALDRVERPWFGRLAAGSLDLTPADRPAETDDLARRLGQVDRWRSQQPSEA